MFQAILCDDNEIILEGLSSQIKWKDLGIELTATAADGNEAWELIQKNPPDLLITDIRYALYGWSGTFQKGPGTKSQHSDPDHQRLR